MVNEDCVLPIRVLEDGPAFENMISSLDHIRNECVEQRVARPCKLCLGKRRLIFAERTHRYFAVEGQSLVGGRNSPRLAGGPASRDEDIGASVHADRSVEPLGRLASGELDRVAEEALEVAWRKPALSPARGPTGVLLPI